MKKFGKFLIALTVVTLVTAACGHNNDPAIPPPPQYGNPGYPGYGGYPGAYPGAYGCGAVGGMPLHPDGSPYFGTLSSLDYTGGSSSNSLALSLFYMTTPNADNSIQQIVSSGNFNFPDLNALLPMGGATGPTSFCVSTSNPQTGQPNPGTYLPGGGISLVLDGYAQTPYMSPFGGYPGAYGGGYGAPGYGAPSYGQTLIEIAIGSSPYGGGAGLVQGRIMGYVEVTLGVGSPQSMTLHYQSQ